MRKARAEGRRCLREGCERWARRGRAVWGGHGRTETEREIEEATRRLAGQAAEEVGEEGDGEQRPKALAAFGRGLANGEYGAAFDGGIRAAMAQAAAEKGVAEEIGALRLMLARLMAEVPTTEDPVRLGHGVARVAGASVRAARAQKELLGEDTSEFQAALFQALAELDAEEEARRAAEEGAIEGGTLREIGWEARPLAVELDDGLGVEPDEDARHVTLAGTEPSAGSL